MNRLINTIGEVTLIKPFEITIVEDDGEYISSIANLNLFTYSSDLEEAIEELKTDLSYLHKRLFIDKVDVGGNALKIKNELEKYLK